MLEMKHTQLQLSSNFVRANRCSTVVLDVSFIADFSASACPVEGSRLEIFQREDCTERDDLPLGALSLARRSGKESIP